MAVVKELWRGVRGDQDRRSIGYLVTDATSDNDALDALELQAPFIYDNMPRENISIREESKKDGLYRAEAHYTRRSQTKPALKTDQKPQDVTGPDEPTSDDPDKEKFSFDVSVEAKNVTYIRDGSKAVAAGGQFVDVKTGATEALGFYDPVKLGGLNYEPGFGFRGQYLMEPRASFSLVITPDDSKVTRTYQNEVMAMVGKVNSVPFRGWDAGEVMLVSARGESRNSTDWQFSFNYDVRETQFNVDLGNQVTFASVEGWDLIDPWYENQTIDTGGGQKTTLKVCRQAIVYRIYGRADLGTIIIGDDEP